MKILVTGANGLLGQHLVQLLVREGYRVVATGRGASRLPALVAAQCVYYDTDITDEWAVHDLFVKEAPEVVVHAAAMTQVDECQLNPERCEAVNVKATAQLALEAEAVSRHFIYLSTDFVFDGEKGDYSEEDHLNPVSWYGFTKVQAESIVETSELPWTIVRTCPVYGDIPGGGRSNIISWVKKSLEEKKAIKVVSDQWRTPTYVEDLALGVLLIIRQKAEGIYHISGKDRLSPYEMALTTAARAGLDASLIERVDAGSFRQPAKRPPVTGFDISKARRELGYEPRSFEEGFALMSANWSE
jgi:dTDP-4-dehydrorhamnose reductase